jgi:hypothetical protein
MLQKFLLGSSVFLSLLMTICFVAKTQKHVNNQIIIDKMPLVQDDPYAYLAKGYSPIEQRDERVARWLATGVKINVSGASGSGTIIYYDDSDGYAYVQSCGHLWDGNMSANEGARRKITCNVITWYHNSTKLDLPMTYKAEVLYYSNSRGRDCSLLRFRPDWKPDYLPIAPDNFQFVENSRFHSVGCDGGNEVAHYDVRYVGMRGDRWPDLVTTENSPRPGRSGGGLMSDDYYVGICWGTTAFDGGGNGFFTPLKTIREYNESNGYGWLNNVGFNLARQIPIIDRNNPQGKYPKDYIPLPD